MTYSLKNAMMVPPSHDGQSSGFEFQEPGTGVWLDGKSLSGTISLVMRHRTTNGLPRQSEQEVDQDVQTQICQRVGTGWCDNDFEGKWNFPTSWDAVVSGSRTLARLAATVATGRPAYVPQEEANRRAEICSRCFANQRSGGCLSCGFFDMVRGLVAECGPSQATPHDDKLHSCKVCQCLLVKKVHVSKEIINSGMSEQQQSAYNEIPNCWLANSSI